jgi:hypothetical protein
MLSTCSKARAEASISVSVAAKLAADPTVKLAATERAASLRTIDLFMTFSSKHKDWTLGKH